LFKQFCRRLAASPGFTFIALITIAAGAQVIGNEVRFPHVEVRRVSSRSVRSPGLGWIVRDDRGRDFVAGAIPVAVSAGTANSDPVLRHELANSPEHQNPGEDLPPAPNDRTGWGT